ncbi:MAG: hypothetical protein A3A73_00690 [Omnitrophica bacterium RIFCSPLOWO2_01_FULL_50_24]|nr:MAG: hypothetical protein A3A73_00690 [Omnitrophica bacterium RIFCSPLOWO2_01_FULL_50_24]
MPRTLRSAIDRFRPVFLERRKETRIPCLVPLRFSPLSGTLAKPLHIGRSKDVSSGGMKLTAMTPLERNSVALLDFDTSKITAHVEIEKILTISARRVIVEVVWRKLNLDTGLFDAGVRFIERTRANEFEDHILKAKTLD